MRLRYGQVYRITVTNPAEQIDLTASQQMKEQIQRSVSIIQKGPVYINDFEARRRALEIYWGVKGRKVTDWSLEDFGGK